MLLNVILAELSARSAIEPEPAVAAAALHASMRSLIETATSLLRDCVTDDKSGGGSSRRLSSYRKSSAGSLAAVQQMAERCSFLNERLPFMVDALYQARATPTARPERSPLAPRPRTIRPPHPASRVHVTVAHHV